MTTISERLRAAGCHYGIPIERDTAEAADTIDALEVTLERVRQDINWMLNEGKFLSPHVFDYLDAALALARKGGK